MGKHFNAEMYRKFDRTMDRGLDEAMGDVEPTLTEAEKAAQWDEQYWDRLEAAPRRVGLWDEL